MFQKDENELAMLIIYSNIMNSYVFLYEMSVFMYIWIKKCLRKCNYYVVLKKGGKNSTLVRKLNDKNQYNRFQIVKDY